MCLALLIIPRKSNSRVHNNCDQMMDAQQMGSVYDSESTAKRLFHANGLCPPPSTSTKRTIRHNCQRVTFIDQVHPSYPLVTQVSYRPYTRPEDKPLLYYNSQDYAYFALEDYYEKLERNAVQVAIVVSPASRKTFGWEDYMNIDEDSVFDTVSEYVCCIQEVKQQMKDQDMSCASSMHKVNTRWDLHS